MSHDIALRRSQGAIANAAAEGRFDVLLSALPPAPRHGTALCYASRCAVCDSRGVRAWTAIALVAVSVAVAALIAV